MISRRDVLSMMPLAPFAASAAPAIRKVEVFTAPYRVTSYFKFLPKPERPSLLVKLTCEDGTAGWGQSVPLPTWSYETPESAGSALRTYLAPALIGRNPFDLAGIHAAMNQAIAPSFSTGMPIAKAGIDLAVHDLMGKLAGRSLAELWGRKPLERIALSWTVNARTLDEAGALMEDGRARGYKHFNLKVSPDLKYDVELCLFVRKAAPEAWLWVDANGGYDLETALQAARRFADIGVDVFEQPIAPNRLSGLREIRKLRALPILFDEGVVSSVELVEFIRLGLLDGVAMKPARTAGLWDARRQVEILREAGLMVLASGLTDPDVSLAASLALFGAYEVKHPAALNGPQFLASSYLKQPFRMENGSLRVPAGPGLGVEVDEAKLTG